MPTLDFKGKQHVYAHHLTVPYRPLEPDNDRSLNSTGVDDNMIIHGDNLHGLKALLPRYAGKVKCIYIDPPYNTGHEGWVYNDKVNSPLMKEWLTENGPVDGEDLERHEKWLCMMWPRLQLLKELLADDGVIFVSIDDNEQHHLRMLMDEVFGEDNLIGIFHWRKKGTSTNVRGASVSALTDYQICYRRSISGSLQQRVTSKDTRRYPHSDSEGAYRTAVIEKRSSGEYARPTMEFQILGRYPREGRRWQIGEKLARDLESRNRFLIENGVVKRKIYDFEDRDTRSANPTLLPDACGSSDSATKELISIFGQHIFDNPKPTALIQHILRMAANKDSIILDSFAGSGTTAHAVLALNKEDGGSRKFVLIECEDYANSLTAERVRRVIKGVPEAGESTLREGLGGSFVYCTLGDPIGVEQMLSGESLPEYADLAAYLLHTAGLTAEGRMEAQNEDGLFYRDGDTDYYLLYRPDIEWLRSNEAILNEQQAKRIHGLGRNAVVYAADKYMGQRFLTDLGITFCQIPYELHRRL